MTFRRYVDLRLFQLWGEVVNIVSLIDFVDEEDEPIFLRLILFSFLV
jgi:hypothetical protein